MSQENIAKILRVDLEKGKIERFTVDEKIFRQFIGGTGLGAKLLYDEVLPGTEWFSPQNRLIFANGPLNATPIGGSGSISVITKGPLTNGAGCSQANGYFGSYLKLCGLNGIIIQGVAQNLQYLYVDSESAELKDASWLEGMDTYKTSDLIKHEHGLRKREMSVASIGPAGENLVKFAGIFFDHGHSASHNGLGAVMGSKRLKAISVKRGTQKVTMHDADRVQQISKELIDNVKSQARTTYEYGTLNGIHSNGLTNMIPVKNYTTSTWNIEEDKWQKFGGQYIREKFSIERNSCWACQIHHCDIMKITEGPYAGEVMEEPEYEQFAAWASAIGQEDVTAAMMLSKEVDRLGMETNEAGWVIGFAMECYEKGILTGEKANDLDLSWGKADSARLLLHLIAYREGVGDLLAEGVMRAAKKIGVGTESFAIHTLKGNTPRGHDYRNRWTEQFDTCISNTGTLETWGGPLPLGTTPKWEDIVAVNLNDKGGMMFEDSLVTCRFNTRTNVDLLSQALSAVTGWDFSWDEGLQVGRRIIHLLRAFNIRHGIIGREMDRPSQRYGSEPDAGLGKGKSLKEVWDKMLDAYYTGMGWDSLGKPLPETLKKYGLDYVVKDLWL
ncbi:MAG: aldehyde ferredoxin oxidoreductase C-terminal domain-containing protein [Nitrososphaeria archaeon]|jgi:aldehyde:ferredoxin oxidoreductase